MIKAINPPENCDICKDCLKRFPTFYDGRTVHGPWAWMCEECWHWHGTGLGTGFGQQYDSVTNEKLWG